MEENASNDSASSTVPSDSQGNFKDETLEKLSKGLLAMYGPHLEKTRDQLRELTEKQVVLIEQLHEENLKISWSRHSVELIKTFDEIGVYQTKLNNVKRDIRAVHDKNLKLKKRAIRLQQYKEKMVYLQSQQREAELKREQNLIGGNE